MIFNYDLPSKNEYLDRCGRSGKFGRKGVVINFVNTGEEEIIKSYIETFNTKIDELPMDFKEYF